MQSGTYVRVFLFFLVLFCSISYIYISTYILRLVHHPSTDIFVYSRAAPSLLRCLSLPVPAPRKDHIHVILSSLHSLLVSGFWFLVASNHTYIFIIHFRFEVKNIIEITRNVSWNHEASETIDFILQY